MEWKKENISGSELEKRQREYMNEVYAMMKKSRTVITETVSSPVSGSDSETDGKTDIIGKNTDKPEETVTLSEHEKTASEVIANEAAAEEVIAKEAPAKEETAEEVFAKEAAVEEETITESEIRHEEVIDDNDDEKSDETAFKAESDENYGVYTAEQLMTSEPKNDGLKKAAEMLEEMTKKTEYMKALVNSGKRKEQEMLTAHIEPTVCPVCGKVHNGRR